MLALVFDGRRVELREDAPRPMPAHGEALVRVHLAGICNTDLEITKGYMGFTGVLGHEFVGTVIEGSDRWRGCRVVGEINCPCGECRLCGRGLGNHCPKRTVLGIAGRDGAFAEYLALPEANLHAVPDGVRDREAVFVEPLAAACRILDDVHPTEETRVAVLGDGKLGLLVSQVVKETGCDLTLLGHHPEKLKVAESVGIHIEERPRPAVAGSTGVRTEKEGRPSTFDIVVDCTGSAAGFQESLDLVRPRGTIVLKSTVAERPSVDLARIVIDEITVIGSRCGPSSKALDALSSRTVEVAPLITAEYPLADAPAAMQRAAEPGALKVLLRMTAE